MSTIDCDALPIGVVLHGPTGEIQAVNARALQLLGLTDDQLRGRQPMHPDWNVMAEDGTVVAGATQPAVEAIARRRPVRNVVLGVYRPDKRDRIWLLANADPRIVESAADHDGEAHTRRTVECVVVTLADITSRKQIEESIARARRVEAVSTLAGGMANDFNNLLSIVTNCAHLAQMRVSDDEARADLDRIIEATRAGAALTRQLLAMAHDRVIVPRVLMLDRLLPPVVNTLSRELGESISVSLDLGHGLWPVRMDPDQLQQVLHALVANAAEAMPEGGSLSIRVANRRGRESAMGSETSREDHILLAVRDTGVGMREDELARAFDPFFSTRSVNAGAGLGLTTVRSVVRQAGGVVAIRSERGAGTTVRIRLPRWRDADDSQSRVNSTTMFLIGRETVLVVEDEPTVRMLIERILEAQGYTVAAATSRDALATGLAMDRVDLVITATAMPGIRGGELVDRLARTHAGLHALFIRTDGTPPDDVDDRPATAWLEKPFTPGELTDAIRLLLDTRTL